MKVIYMPEDFPVEVEISHFSRGGFEVAQISLHNTSADHLECHALIVSSDDSKPLFRAGSSSGELRLVRVLPAFRKILFAEVELKDLNLYIDSYDRRNAIELKGLGFPIFDDGCYALVSGKSLSSLGVIQFEGR